MPDAKPYEILSIEDKEQFPTRHGTTLQAMQWSVKGGDGTVLSVGVNRRPATPPPNVGETVWLETWENENGFLKGKKAQGPRQTSTGQASFTPDGSRESAIVRQHSQHMALRWAEVVAKTNPEGEAITLNTIEAWTDHFDADVDRAAQQGQGGGGPPAQPTTGTAPSNGDEPTITPAQITNFILKRQKMYGISDEDMGLLVKSFGVEKLRDLPRSKVDEFAAAMPNPIPTGESDIPNEPEPVASEADSEIPF